MMRRPFIFLLPLLLGQCVDGSMPAAITLAPNQRIVIKSKPVALDTSYPERRRIGALRFLGGWQLTSDTRGFGGFSAIDVSGDRVTALSDAGTITRFRLGRFGNISNASIVRLPAGCGKVVYKTDNDTEALAHNPARTQWWVSYEARNAICRTNGDFTVGQSVFAPKAMAAWPPKLGPETMTRLADSRFLVIAENRSAFTNLHAALIFDRDPSDRAAVVSTLTYQAPAGFRPTAVDQLADGRILVVNRRFALTDLFSAELVLLPRIAPSQTGTLKGRTIARFTSPTLAENFEGISVSKDNGKPVIWILSDDNFLRWQRTLLLKFALD